MNYKRVIFLILLLLPACDKLERTNVLEPDGSEYLSVMDFSEALTLDPVPDGWHHRTFWRHSPMDISFITKDERPSIRLSTDNTASMLFRYVDIQLNQYPFLSWEWFIEQGIYSDLSELTPEGDDHPARFYLSFEAENGDTHRMEIIWGNKELHRGDWKHLKFSETRSFPHYVANGGEENIGQWHAEKVDLTELYQTLWGSAKGAKLKEIALFCDTDETDLKSIAYFSNIGIEKATSN